MLKTAERFLKIELHPAVYVSFVALNLCLVFVYREMAVGQHHQENLPLSFASSRLDDPKGLRPDTSEADFSIASARLLAQKQSEKIRPVIANSKTGDVSEKHDLTPADVSTAPKVSEIVIAASLSSGAALAAVSEASAPKPRKKSKRPYNGLIPPPPPGVMVVPPPPDAPSFFAAGSAGKFGFLVPPPPPMVFDSLSSEFPERITFRKATRHRENGDFKNNERAKTVHRGNYKQVIVSR